MNLTWKVRRVILYEHETVREKIQKKDQGSKSKTKARDEHKLVKNSKSVHNCHQDTQGTCKKTSGRIELRNNTRKWQWKITLAYQTYFVQP